MTLLMEKEQELRNIAASSLPSPPKPTFEDDDGIFL